MSTFPKLGFAVAGSLLFSTLLFATAPVMQRPDAIGLTLGAAVDYHVVATGAPTAFTATNLPNGVTIDASTGWIHGQPTDVGTSYVSVSATNNDGTSSVDITIAVVAPDAAPLIYAPLLFDAYESADPGGDQFTFSLKTTGSPSSITASDVPNGWTFTDGTISGSSSVPGLYSVSVNATNSYGVGSAAVTVRVHPACTQCDQSSGTLHVGDVFRVTLTFNHPVSFSGAAPYLGFHTAAGSPTRRVEYVSGNGTNQLVFEYTITTGDAAGDIMLDPQIAPTGGASVTGLADSLGLEAGASLPLGSPSIPSARIAAPEVTTGVTSGVSTGTSSPSSDAGTGTATVSAGSSSIPSDNGGSSGPTTTTDTGTGSSGSIASNANNGSGSASETSGSSSTPTPTTTTATNSDASAGGTTAARPTGNSTSPASAPGDTNSAPTARLVNLSARGLVSDGASGSSFIAGFVVSGSAPKRMLLRAAGPALSSYGVTNPLPDPSIRVLDSKGNEIKAANSSDAASASIARSVGAFALPAGGKDAAVTLTLAPGTYSMQVLPNGHTGVALAEVYDADNTGSSAPLVNLSSRGLVGTGENVLTAGFVVAGSAPKTLLVRGVGPALAAHGVSSVLARPVVTIYRESTQVARNDGWDAGEATATAAVTAAAAKVGAFPLAPGSADAALLVTVDPGTYTAVVSSGDGQPGAALVEVYEVR